MQKAPGQLDFAPDRNSFPARRIERRKIGGNTGTEDDQILRVERFEAMSAQLEGDALGAESRGRLGELRFRQLVCDCDLSAALDAEERRGDAGARQAYD